MAETTTQTTQTTQSTTKQFITRETTIGDIVAQYPYPEIVETLMGFGVHCVGCGASAYESLEDGFAGHGMGDTDIDEAVRQLNEVIGKIEEERSVAPAPVETESKQDYNLTLTESAAAKIRELRSREKKDDHALRIRIIPGGCSGFQYRFIFDNKTTADDTILEKHGVNLCVDKESLAMLNNAKIDFVDTLQGSGFKIDNPNSTDNCHCGKSFK
ncbi:MAG: iron-sulfur cluster insertion protein ErpA [Candidatus Woesearchaeota archaeon]|nr:iron-sulfur cluster insertion protein ErpA [Candidatus Woesearchaeota archaeon]